MDPPDRPLYLVCRLPDGAKGEAIKKFFKKRNLSYTTDSEAFLKKLEEDKATNRATNQSGGVKQLVAGPDGNQPIKSPNPSWDQENRVSNSSGDDKHMVTGPCGDEPFNSQNPSWDQIMSLLSFHLSVVRKGLEEDSRPIEQKKTVVTSPSDLSLQLTEEEMENEKRLALESTRAMIENCKQFSRRIIAEKRQREAAAARKKLLDEKNEYEKELAEFRRLLDFWDR